MAIPRRRHLSAAASLRGTWTLLDDPLVSGTLVRCLLRLRCTEYWTFLGERFPCSLCLVRQRIHIMRVVDVPVTPAATSSSSSWLSCSFLDKVLDKPVVVQRLVGWSRQCRILAFSCSSWTRLFVAHVCNDRDHGPDSAESMEFVQFLDKVVDVPVVFQRLVDLRSSPTRPG